MTYSILDKNSSLNIILAGIISFFIGVGVARFAYTSILPSMLESNTLSLTFSGILASINYVGYLTGSFATIFLNSLKIRILLFKLGLIISIISTALFIITEHEILWLIGRVIAGFGTAMVLVVGPAIAMQKLININSENITQKMGYFFTSIGFSILFCDILAQTVLPNWYDAWFLLIITATCLIFYPLYIFTYNKEESTNTKKHKLDVSLFTPFVIFLILAYFTEGVGYVIQGTFLPTIIKSLPGVEEYSSLSWLLVGITGIPSAIIWMYLASKYGSVNMIQSAMGVQVIGILIPTITTNIILNLLSGVIYGFTFVGLVAMFLNLGGKLAKNNPVVLMGALTTAYGLGQIIAPLYAVYFTSQTESYNIALYITASIVFIGIIFLFFARNLTSFQNLK